MEQSGPLIRGPDEIDKVRVIRLELVSPRGSGVIDQYRHWPVAVPRWSGVIGLRSGPASWTGSRSPGSSWVGSGGRLAPADWSACTSPADIIYVFNSDHCSLCVTADKHTDICSCICWAAAVVCSVRNALSGKSWIHPGGAYKPLL